MPYIRALRAKDAESDGSNVMTFVASTPGVKRDGLKIEQTRWRLDDYRLNPVVLWSHDYSAPPIGRADVAVEDNKLMARVTWDDEDETAQMVRGKYERGFLNAVSVGWRDVEDDGVWHELLDVSAVPVPGDPQALAERTRTALRELVRELEGESDTDAEGRSWESLAAEMVSAMSPRPDEAEVDRRKRYDACLPAYRRAGRTPPEWMDDASLHCLGVGGDLWRGLFLEGEVMEPEQTRVGAVLNARNRERLAQIRDLAQAVLDSAEPAKDTEAETDETDTKDAKDGRQDITAQLRSILEVLK